ncbi:MAG TPA: ATP-binding cassette domain-containing protein [Vicinamibacterales bacterium]|nr:ATP-binding cassette domain-containing protein [Vicinamibacterales bacterium]
MRVETGSVQEAERPTEGAVEPVVRFEEVSLAFDEKVVLDRVTFDLLPGRMRICLGASGAGKSTVLRLVLGLLKPDAGRIFVKGQRVDQLRETEWMVVRADLGMVFQEGGLFDSFTVRENVGYRLYEETERPLEEVDARVRDVLGYVGLEAYGGRRPSELSGGQRRRVAIARALAARPGILLYDEPTTGLDPITALTIDEQIIKLRDLDHVSSIVVTHQLRDAFYIATHQAVERDGTVVFEPAAADVASRTTFLVLKDGGVAFEGTAADLRQSADPYLKAFLS